MENPPFEGRNITVVTLEHIGGFNGTTSAIRERIRFKRVFKP